MSGALPVVSGKETVQALQRTGFTVISTRGSHQKLRDLDGHAVIVPLHRQLARGTLASILRQAGLGPEEFKGLL
jgi:predicted RNA binding protein YcfA (HicA-like mRNA interferase family)